MKIIRLKYKLKEVLTNEIIGNESKITSSNS